MGLKTTIDIEITTEEGSKGHLKIDSVSFSEEDVIRFLSGLKETYGGTLHIEKSEGQLE